MSSIPFSFSNLNGFYDKVVFSVAKYVGSVFPTFLSDWRIWISDVPAFPAIFFEKGKWELSPRNPAQISVPLNVWPPKKTRKKKKKYFTRHRPEKRKKERKRKDDFSFLFLFFFWSFGIIFSPLHTRKEIVTSSYISVFGEEASQLDLSIRTWLLT